MTEQRTAAEIRAYCEDASAGPWYAHATDDDVFMNARYVGLRPAQFWHDNLRGMEPNGDDQEPSETVIAITCLQSPRLADVEECDANTIFIANAREDMLRLLDAVVKLREARLQCLFVYWYAE